MPSQAAPVPVPSRQVASSRCCLLSSLAPRFVKYQPTALEAQHKHKVWVSGVCAALTVVLQLIAPLSVAGPIDLLNETYMQADKYGMHAVLN